MDIQYRGKIYLNKGGMLIVYGKDRQKRQDAEYAARVAFDQMHELPPEHSCYSIGLTIEGLIPGIGWVLDDDTEEVLPDTAVIDDETS